jgi:hypothetical protein
LCRTVFHVPGRGKAMVRRTDATTGKVRESGVEMFAVFRATVKPVLSAKGKDGLPVCKFRLRYEGDVKDAMDAARWAVFWETLVLLMIGDTVPDSHRLLGAYIVDRCGKAGKYRVELWFSCPLDEGRAFLTKFLADLRKDIIEKDSSLLDEAEWKNDTEDK